MDVIVPTLGVKQRYTLYIMHTTCKTGFDVYTRMNTRYVVIRTGKSSDTFAVVAVDAVDARAVVLARIRQTFVHVDLAHFA